MGRPLRLRPLGHRRGYGAFWKHIVRILQFSHRNDIGPLHGEGWRRILQYLYHLK